MSDIAATEINRQQVLLPEMIYADYHCGLSPNFC
ncbi:hypothetical protein O185_24490 [Photorhabdus temperata J3]|uniref:Uncharacterized protein n=1 Tax=Photorhabdus temperata J3 TaxID=1389415 RepID=U7QRA9_PHOTE|nr:hypothetical protein O185_24490 [Photorhabdus temperata J3]